MESSPYPPSLLRLAWLKGERKPQSCFLEKKWTILFFTIFLSGFSLFTVAQEQQACVHSLSGKVIDEHDHSPLSYATVFIKELNKGTISDSLGNYEIAGLCEGEYEVKCEHIGCEPVTLKVKIKGNTVKNFYPEHHEEELQAIMVTGKKTTHAGHAQETIAEKELTQTRGKSLGESLNKIPGVTILQTGPTIAKPVIHGLHSSRIIVLNNDVRQEDQQWGSEHAPEIDPFIASRISVVKGAGALRYGSDALGGVVLVEPLPLPRTAGINGEVNLVGMSNGWQGIFSGRLDGGAKKWNGFGWRIQGTLKKAGDMRAPEYNLSNTGSDEKNVSAAVGFHRTKYYLEIFYSYLNKELGILRASHIGNLTDLQNALQSNEPWYVADFTYGISSPRQKMQHHLLKAKGRIFTGSSWKMEMLYGFQLNNRKEFDIRRGAGDDVPSIALDLQTHTFDFTAEHQKKKLRSIVGIAGFYQRNFNQPGTGTRPLIPNYRSYSPGIYWVERYSGRKWEGEIGVRYDYKLLRVVKYNLQNELVKPELDFHNFSATIGSSVKIARGLSFTTNAGISFRPPNVSELFSEGLHHGAAAIEEGTENLQTERGMKWTGTVDYQFKNRVDIHLTGYYNYIVNYIYLQPQQELRLTVRGAFPVFSYLQTNAGLGGFDFSMKFMLFKNIHFRAKGSVIRAKDFSNDDYLVQISAPRFENELSYETAKLKKLEDFSVSFGSLNVLRQKQTPAGADFAPPPAGYMLFHFNAGITVPLKNHKLGFGFSIENLLNSSYRDYMNKFRYYADDTGRNFILRIKYFFQKQ